MKGIQSQVVICFLGTVRKQKLVTAIAVPYCDIVIIIMLGFIQTIMYENR